MLINAIHNLINKYFNPIQKNKENNKSTGHKKWFVDRKKKITDYKSVNEKK